MRIVNWIARWGSPGNGIWFIRHHIRFLTVVLTGEEEWLHPDGISCRSSGSSGFV